jgi:hypothetical protein
MTNSFWSLTEPKSTNELPQVHMRKWLRAWQVHPGRLLASHVHHIVSDMNSTQPPPAQVASRDQLPLWALAAMAAITFLAGVGGLLGSVTGFVVAIKSLLTNGVQAGLILLAAGGYGWLVCRFFVPASAPRGLNVATATAVGLWLLSVAVMLCGSMVRGSLSGWVWWPVVLAGVGLVMLQAHRPLGKVSLPAKVNGSSLVWVLAALAAGMWVAGSAVPPGAVGALSFDNFEVLGQTLEQPRQFYEAGHIAANGTVPAAPPQGMEMLFLLAICLRGGPYEGMQLATMLPGLYAILALAAVSSSTYNRRPACAGSVETTGETPVLPQADFGARAAVVFLATAPWVIYLSWLALPDLAGLAGLAMALVWLKHFLAASSVRHAAMVGLSLGLGCAASWHSAIFIAGPVLLALLILAAIKAERLRAVLVAVFALGAVCLPVVIGGACLAGSPGQASLLPPPPEANLGQVHPAGGWPAYPAAAFLLALSPFADIPTIGGLVLVILLGTVVAMVLRPRHTPLMDWVLLGALVVQLATWAVLSDRLPARLAALTIVPISLLSAGGLARLAAVRQIPWLKQQPGASGHWGLAPATVLVIASALIGFGGSRAYRQADAHAAWATMRPFAAAKLPAITNGRLLLVEEPRRFYFPANAVGGDGVPSILQDAARDGASSEELAGRLRRAGITHVHVFWLRLTHKAARDDAARQMSAGLHTLLDAWPVVDEVVRPPSTSASGPTIAPSPPLFILYAVPDQVTSKP